MSMVAKWTVHCDGQVMFGDTRCRCSSSIVGQPDEDSHGTWRRAIGFGWTHDLRTGEDHCERSHLEAGGGDTTP